ncbi:hypothetical protein LJ737_08530 [Hymenobacter sp. 15J16-1T3B]|uniref:hypothetical protein n=1 Tax=Hymenobacter sp. 15J16-1T3B TaxID=2886941 RepID=UPI001D12C86D|nr:hypothetical protein [Hymenobacter sp. 15J16-1T3B]MCC3157282.1 hypothetical protein [Hymenobacter sp. 15J16-1T3B]
MNSPFPTTHFLRRGLAAAALLLATAGAATAQAPTDLPATTRYRATALGLSMGWDAPYGFGLEVSHLVTRRLDVNAGTGIGLSGTKLGVGTRYFLAPERRMSPYFGLNLVRSGGWDSIELREGGGDDWYEGDGYRTGTLTVRPCTVLHLRSGLRWQPGRRPGRVGLIGTMGYGLRVSGNPMRYHMDPGQELPDAVDRLAHRIVYAPGGLEVSLGLSIGLGQKARE